jgi:serine phosphatase RsbU (regulator of sigma subunit)/two-component sensor histidine kinase
MKTWWTNLPLHIKLNLPIQLALLFALPVSHLWVMGKFESKMLDEIQLRTRDSATQSLLALNSMMPSGTIGNQTARTIFFSKMSVQNGVEDFHLVRTDAVQKQYGPGLEAERQGDDLDRVAAETGKEQAVLSHQGAHTLRMVVPFPAKREFYGTNCLQCHQVPEGTVLGTISLKINLDPEYRKIQELGSVLLFGQIFLQFMLFFLIWWLIRNITKSVGELESVMLYVKENEDFSKRSDVQGNDEIGRIAQVFNSFVAHIEDLHLRLAEKIAKLEEYCDKTEEELRIGSDIMSRINDAQSTLDPSVRMQIIPASHYSGDIILVSRTPTDTLHIMLADAVGHGLIAAINLLPLSQIFKAMSKKGFSILRIAEELNSKIHRLMPVDRFIGAILISINFQKRVIEVWNGGQPAPILIHLDGTILHKWQSRNLPLGILKEVAFSSEVEIFHYEDNCQLYIFSDGLPEAESCERVQFGRERIKQVLQTTESGSRFDALMSSLGDHLGGRPAHDDISLALVNISLANVQESITRNDSGTNDDVASSSHWRIAISLGASELKYLDAITLVSQIVGKIHVAAEHYSPLYVILNELFNNALDHGILRMDSSIKHGPDGFEQYLHLREDTLRALTAGSIDIEIENVMIEGHYGIKIQIADSGNGFDYSTIQNTSLENAVLGQHGRGLALVRSMTHKLEFSGKGNTVTVYYVCD